MLFPPAEDKPMVVFGDNPLESACLGQRFEAVVIDVLFCLQDLFAQLRVECVIY